jgi:hypothetical protein
VDEVGRRRTASIVVDTDADVVVGQNRTDGIEPVVQVGASRGIRDGVFDASGFVVGFVEGGVGYDMGAGPGFDDTQTSVVDTDEAALGRTDDDVEPFVNVFVVCLAQKTPCVGYGPGAQQVIDECTAGTWVVTPHRQVREGHEDAFFVEPYPRSSGAFVARCELPSVRALAASGERVPAPV